MRNMSLQLFIYSCYSDGIWRHVTKGLSLNDVVPAGSCLSEQSH